jgi:hypothetical protein
MKPGRQAAEEAAAQDYADAIWAGAGKTDWASLNEYIVRRWSRTALKRIKARAWQIIEIGRRDRWS